MNQIDTGKFIAACRKEKGLTQAQLAEKLNITDRAVSKWETGKCMPDSSIMLELCDILGVTANELLSGERIEIDDYEEKVNENLIELKRKDENNMNKNAIAIISKIKIDTISQISITGPPIIFDKVLFIKSVNGIANKNVIPVAKNFRS